MGYPSIKTVTVEKQSDSRIQLSDLDKCDIEIALEKENKGEAEKRK